MLVSAACARASSPRVGCEKAVAERRSKLDTVIREAPLTLVVRIEKQGARTQRTPRSRARK